MSTDYNYDEQGQFFPFFILTITGLVTLPLTYSLLRPSKELENTAPRIKSDFKPEDEDLIQGQKRKQWRKERRIKRIITVALGYAVMAWMVYLIAVTARTIPKIWDPYNILGISRLASEKDIKSKYRKLTLQYHPDKVQLDTSTNQTMEDVTSFYVEISKAYKALTDEEIRNNYVQYGHPDGKQSFSIGIALPKFIITDGNGKYVLLVYGLLLGVLLPYVVGKWWYGTQRVTKDRVLVASAGHLFKEYKDDITDGGVISALSSGEEFKSVLKGNKADAGLGKLEKAILADGEVASSAAGLTLKERQTLEDLEGVRRKSLALLWAYLGRIGLKDSTLDDEKYEVAPLALAMNEAFVTICLAYGSLGPLLSAYRASQHLIQAIPPKASPLLQLPHITPSIARSIEGPNTKRHMTVQQFMSMPEYQRRKLSTDQPGSLSPQQYNDAVAVARQIPLLKVEKVFFKVMGEKYITTGSLVQFVAKARVIPPGTANVPEVNELDLEDVDPDEGDLDALLGRKAAKNSRVKQLEGSGPANTEEKAVQPPLAYAPYFPRDHSPRWHMFLGESKQGRVAVPPTTITTFTKPIFDDDGRPTFNMQTMKLQFQAPPQAGNYTFVMHLVCDSYVGMDSKMEATLVVEDSNKAAEIEEEDEISEPEEDSLAGQMNALKTGGLSGPAPKPKRPRKAIAEDSSDDDESDTDGEADDTSETDTDTDTDGE
ncbi:secretory subunit [Xylographa carneopallida]|nr:secretory subunit [Xylographa carneopallida]